MSRRDRWVLVAALGLAIIGMSGLALWCAHVVVITADVILRLPWPIQD